MRNRLVEKLDEMAFSDERIVLVTGDLGYGVLEGFAKHHPDRYYNAGIAEQNMTGVAAGLALEGFSVFTYSIGNFNTVRCFEHLRNDVCYPNLDVNVVSTAGGFAYGQLGMSHHATEDIAAMRSLPNMRVLVPSDPLEAVEVLDVAASSTGPCYIRLARGGEPRIHAEGLALDITKPIQIRRGADVAIFGCGTVVAEAVAAADLLSAQGVQAAVYSLPTIKPLAVDAVAKIAGGVGLVATVEEHNVIGGLGSAIAELLAGLDSCPPLLRIGMKDEFTSVVGSQAYLRNVYGLSSERIAGAVCDRLNLGEDGVS